MDFKFEPIPPPKEVRINKTALDLGVLHCLECRRSNDQWRCASCHTIQPAGAWEAWLPDSVRQTDPPWSVIEACRTNAFSGHFSAWCISCTPKPEPPSPYLPHLLQSTSTEKAKPHLKLGTINLIVGLPLAIVDFGLGIYAYSWSLRDGANWAQAITVACVPAIIANTFVAAVFAILASINLARVRAMSTTVRGHDSGGGDG